MKPIAEIVWAGGIEDSIKDVKFYKVPSPDVGTKLYTHPVKELTDEEYAGIGLHLFRIGEATSIKDGIRLVKLIVELTNIRKAKRND